jgi:DNA-binding SARP family transcriptional activator
MADLVRRKGQTDGSTNASPQGLIELTLLLAAGGGLALALWGLTGAPTMPSTFPDWKRIGDVLSGSYLPYEGIVSAVAVLAWLALAYLTATLVLRLLCEMAVRLSDGSSWARAAHKVSDFVTLPVVGRVVDGAIAGSLVLAAGLRSTPTALAEQPHQMSIATAAIRPQSTLTHLAAPSGELQPLIDNRPIGIPSGGEFLSYTVVAGDNLWEISRRIYGDGTLYITIFDANEGRVMTRGELFTNPRLILPGWVLDVPLPAHNVWLNGSHVMYRVREHDSLWRISESFLGSGLRWTEIWELNQGREMVGGGRFTNPGYILPGWILEVPAEVSVVVPESVAEPKEASPVPAASPTVVPSALPTSPSQSTPVPSSITRVEPIPGAQPQGDNGRQFPLPVEPLVATVAGLAAAGGIALVVRQLARRNGVSPRMKSRRQGGARGHGTGDVGKVIVASRALLQGLAEFGFDDLSLILVKESERFLEFTLQCAPGDADAAVRSRHDLGRRLACAIDGEVVSETRIRLKLSRFQRLAGLWMSERASWLRLLLVPAGATDRSVYYLNLGGIGSALLVGRAPDCRKLVSTWVATLAASYPPEEVALLTAGTAASELGNPIALSDLSTRQEAGRERSLEQLASELEETIISRGSAARAGEERATIVAIVGQAEEDSEGLSRLETVLRRGRECGITVVCVAPDADQTQLANAFAAQLAFGMPGSAPDECLLSVHGEPDITLRPVEVRKRPVPPVGREENSVQQLESPVADTQTPPVVLADSDLEQVDRTSETAPLEADGCTEASLAAEPAQAIVAESVSRQPPLITLDADLAEVPQDGATGPIFSVRCFGTFQVDVNGREITDWSFQKARELLAYLIARGGSRATRDEAAEALWPDGELGQVEHQLSNAAYYLRRALKAAVPDIQPLDTSDRRYHLRSGMFRADVDAFDAHLRRAESLSEAESLAEYERALAIYRGDFLAGELYEWADVYRREYQRRFAGAAHKAAALAIECRDLRKAITFYEGVLARDAIDEGAGRGLMRCCAKLGDTNSVRRVYKTLRESLRRELEDEKAEPLPETTALLQELTADPRG